MKPSAVVLLGSNFPVGRACGVDREVHATADQEVGDTILAVGENCRCGYWDDFPGVGAAAASVQTFPSHIDPVMPWPSVMV
jgi:hypothetical protein